MTPAESRARAPFRGKGRQLQLVDALFQNTRALAKVTSAAEYLGRTDDDRYPLWAAIEQLVFERRAMRRELERLHAEEYGMRAGSGVVGANSD